MPLGKSAEWIATAGSGISGPHWPTCEGPLPLATVTVTAAEVAVLPAPSRARAESLCSPLATPVEAQDSSYGAEVSSAPSGLPSRRNWTPAIPLASLALAATVVAPLTVAPAAGAVIVTVGGVVSAAAGVVTVNGAGRCGDVPAPSNAFTVYV